MLLDVLEPLVVRPQVTLKEDMSRGQGVPREHTTRRTPRLAGYVPVLCLSEKGSAPGPDCVLLVD